MSNPPILLQGVGVQYDLHLSRKRSIRKTVYRVTREKVESDRKFWALRNINLTVAAGESIAVIGPNGAGKSTLLQTLAGIIPVTEGKIEVRGDIATLLHLGAGLEDELNAEDNVMLVGAFPIGSRRLLGLSLSQRGRLRCEGISPPCSTLALGLKTSSTQKTM